MLGWAASRIPSFPEDTASSQVELGDEPMATFLIRVGRLQGLPGVIFLF